MKTSIAEAAALSLAMAAVIFFCRAFPFLFSPLLPKDRASGSRMVTAFLDFVERIAPPAAMTVLAFNAIGPSIGVLAKTAANAVMSVPSGAESNGELGGAFSVIIAVSVTAVTHVLKRNALFSIFGGTAVYMVLDRIIAR